MAAAQAIRCAEVQILDAVKAFKGTRRRLCRAGFQVRPSRRVASLDSARLDYFGAHCLGTLRNKSQESSLPSSKAAMRRPGLHIRCQPLVW
jgi:hypothetical protein